MASPSADTVFQRCLLLAILLVCVPSCGGGRESCYPVHGEIFVVQGNDRTPAVGAVVVFHPTLPVSEDVPRPTAHVGEDGKFELTTYLKGDGAPAGGYTITIDWVPPRPPPPHKPKQAGDLLKGRYSDPGKSTISYSVEKNKDNNVPPIELKLP
jgi:hypothetical protein